MPANLYRPRGTTLFIARTLTKISSVVVTWNGQAAGTHAATAFVIIVAAVRVVDFLPEEKMIATRRVGTSLRKKTDKHSPMATGRRGRPPKGRDDSIDVPVPPELKERFKLYCKARQVSMADMINDMINREIGPLHQQQQEVLDLKAS